MFKRRVGRLALKKKKIIIREQTAGPNPALRSLLFIPSPVQVGPPEEHRALRAARLQEEGTRGHLLRLQREASDTEPDSDAQPHGSGPKGRGDPMLVGSHERMRWLCDGAGLCSLGVWAPWQRPEPSHPKLVRAGALLDDFLDALDNNYGFTADDLFARLADGAVATDPFPGPVWDSFLASFVNIVDDGKGSASPRAEDLPQRVRIRLLQEVLRLGGDADVAGMEHFCRGVRIGVGVRLPRTPAVYPRKRRWRSFDEEAHRRWEEEADGSTAWQINYRSAQLQKDEIHRQLLEHCDRGMAIRMSADEARAFPNLSINALGGVEKQHADGRPPTVRMVMDATRGVYVNRVTRQRDQDRCPTSLDVKRVQREQAHSRTPLGLAVDAQDAHRLVRVHPDDWPLQGCRSDLTGEIIIYKVGCFGVATAAYWWSRLGGALVRCLHLVLRPSDELWALLMADDFKLESSAEAPARAVIKSLVLLLLLGVPIAWAKTQGGHRIQWIGYEIWLRELALGISERRAAWCLGFLDGIARDGRFNIGLLRSGVGRLTFVVSALEWERPFLAPFYTYLALHPGFGHRELPLYLRLIARYLSNRISLRRVYPSAVRRPLRLDAFRIDARAEGQAIGVGGWLPVRDQSGVLRTQLSPWFALELSAATAPWAYTKGEPYRSIAALEAVAVLVALVAFRAHLSAGADHIYTVRGLTDNRGNRSSVSRLQSTKFPLCGILMEIAAQSENLGVRLALDWVPREWNQEADQLSNGCSDGFSQHLRVDIDWASVSWEVLDWALAEGAKAEGADRRIQPKKKPHKRLTPKVLFKTTDPW